MGGITTAPKTSPAHSPARRLVRVSSQTAVLPVDGITGIMVEVQDEYNNPVPGVTVNFFRNETRTPGNSYPNGELLQSSAVSGADGRASVSLKTAGAGFYFIDAVIHAYTTTFAYSASSSGSIMILDHTPSGSDYRVTATLKDGLGNVSVGNPVIFNTSDGNLSLPNPNSTVGDGTAIITLNVSNANGTRITNIQIKNSTINPANIRWNITWNTINNITVTAKSGYVFNSRDISTDVSTTSCVRYGTSPGNYGNINCDTGAESSSHLVSLNNLVQNTPYYFIVNSSPPGGQSVNSTEYMFVTEGTGDYTLPGSITNLTNVTWPLFIRWTRDDPEDADFDYVEIMIDDVIVLPPAGIVAKGIKSFNAIFLMPNSTHNISIRTVDTSGNANETWVTQNTSTRSLLTYLFDYTISVGQGNIANWSCAQNGTDGDASAQFDTTQNLTEDRHNYTNVTRNITTVGNISNWANMKNDSDEGAFANFTEWGTFSSTWYRWGFNTTVESWTHAWTGTGGTYTTTNGWQTGDGVPAGSVFSQMTGKGKSITRTSTWTSPSFIWIGGTPTTATLNVSFKVQTYTNAAPGTYYVVLVKPDSSTSEIYPHAAYSATSVWAYKLNNSITPGDFTQSGNYQLQLVSTQVAGSSGATSLTRTIQVRWDEPNITLYTTTNSMNITTYTDPVPVNDIYYLEINYSRDSNDTYNIYIWNGSQWNNRTSLNATPGTWNSTYYTLQIGENNSGNVTIRYLDQNASGTSPGNLSIDYQRIHGYTPGTPGNYYLNVTTNTTGIPNASSQVLQVRYNVSVNEDNFTLQVYNNTTSGWDNKSTLNQTALTLLNITLESNYLLPDGYYSPGNVSDLSRYYMLVRYLGINASKPGKLYLDYQRVNSS
jgi:hypothetical protein